MGGGQFGAEGRAILTPSRAAMILSGMGPFDRPVSPAVQFFEGTYALYSGLLVGTSSLILAPVFYRVLHSLKVEDEEDEKAGEKKPKGSGKRA